MRGLFFLSCGGFDAPATMLRPERCSGVVSMSLTVAVLVRDDGELALIDAGWSEEACADPGKALGRVRVASLGLVAARRDAIAAQLRERGLDPARVRTIVATHLHLDHVEGVCDFPNAEVVTTPREFAAYSGLPRGVGELGYRAKDLARAGRIRLVSVDGEPTLGFPASHDLFGDGELRLLDARGHTRGAIAIALRASECDYLHIGDAAYQRWEYGVSPAGPCRLAHVTAWSRRELRRTYGCVRASQTESRAPIIVPSHDRDVFRTLPNALAPA